MIFPGFIETFFNERTAFAPLGRRLFRIVGIFDHRFVNALRLGRSSSVKMGGWNSVRSAICVPGFDRPGSQTGSGRVFAG